MSPIRSSSAICFQSSVGIADRVVLERAHRLERRVRAAHAAHHLPQHLLLGREVEIHQSSPSSRRHGRHWSPRRVQGLSSSSVGSAMRAVQSVLRSPSTVRRTSTVAQPQPASSVSTCSTVAGEHHRVAGEHRALHAELHAPEPALRARPVGEVALEPRRLVGRVQEDVLRAVAVDREVVVVVHRPPVSRLASAPSTTVVAVTSYASSGSASPVVHVGERQRCVAVVTTPPACSRSRCTTRRRRARRAG